MLSTVYDTFFPRFASFFWKWRHLIDPGWTKGYTSAEALNHPHRKLILEAVERCGYFYSLLEYGCGPGANLALLAEKYPDCEFVGCDLSGVALRNALKRENISYVKGGPADIFFDVLLTDACMIYIKYPEEITDVLHHNYIGCEWHSDDGPFIGEGHWVHNYRKLFPGCKITKIPKEVWPGGGWEKWGSIIEWSR